MDNDDVIATLNHLIEISHDGEQGFRTCAEGVRSPDLKTLLEAAAARCAEGAAELDAKVRTVGGEPAHGGTISGSMHRAWTNIKSAITGMSEHAVLAECESGEDAAVAAYEAALQTSLPADVRTIVERQYQGVKANHERVHTLRNAAA
ncbi:PA2169 family four-helix-bundle protein (plasmid) [Methylocapsa polymorpha]|uniref:PA2169 family four-helix-bundle protein n=1 Tax=Methylocapsa polymorpha TaxID=3080828 RepID=A0ABZ0HY68_9HYPH|nr:PA2169 family four-helix-bundle protein [Methylocapsa sp. RX1]WOJ91683.1 PA2169 family four-helix-bundle protein [Methylocapsa sp. RX1]